MARGISVARRRAHPASTIRAIGNVVVPAMMFPELTSGLEHEIHTSMPSSSAEAGASGLQNEGFDTSLVNMLVNRAKKEQKLLSVEVDLGGEKHFPSAMSKRPRISMIPGGANLTLTREGDTSIFAEQVSYGFGPLSDNVSFTVTPTSFMMYYGVTRLFQVLLGGEEERDYAEMVENAQKMFDQCIEWVRRIWTKYTFVEYALPTRASKNPAGLRATAGKLALYYDFQPTIKLRDMGVDRQMLEAEGWFTKDIMEFLKDNFHRLTESIDHQRPESPWHDWWKSVNDYVVDFAWIKHWMKQDTRRVQPLKMSEDSPAQVRPNALREIVCKYTRAQLRLRAAPYSKTKLPLTIRICNDRNELSKPPGLGEITENLECRKEPTLERWRKWVSFSDGTRTLVFPSVDFSAALNSFLWADLKETPKQT